MAGAPPGATYKLPRFLVQGVVKDDKGNPVEGAALHIGREVAYTDSAGHLMVRFSKPGPFRLSVVPEEFIANGVYEVVSAPLQVRAEIDGNATEVEVVVRRVPTQAKLDKQQQN